VRLGGSVTRNLFTVPAKSGDDETGDGLQLGQRVRHAKFGEGVVLSLEGYGSQARVQVNFSAAGSKWLVLAYAGLQPA